MSNQWGTNRGDPRNNKAALEQLWYTWSAVGLGPLSAGFRIRAASKELSDVNSPRVQGLDRYLRYTLPEGTDRFAITPEMAPICLSLIQTDWGERILVNKTYTGKDGVGRPGAFFIHLLAGLPRDFSVSDAIALWRSPFWQSSDGNIGSSVLLSSIALDELDKERQQIDTMHPKGIDNSWVQDCFPLVIRAYLTWRKQWEHWRSGPQSWQSQASQVPQQKMQPDPPRLYIAAPADMVAAFIAGLTQCLPQQLLTGLTFSTYEHDVRSKGQVLLIGTAWAPSPDEKHHSKQDLPAACYQDGIAINCYHYDQTRTRLEHDSLAIDFAADATRYLSGHRTQRFEQLLKRSSQDDNLTVSRFLHSYDSIVKAPPPSKENVENFLRMPHIADQRLSEEIVQDFIYEQAISDPKWRAAVVLPGLSNLSVQSNRTPALAGALSQFAQGASSRAAAAIDRNDRLSFEAMQELLSSAAPPNRNPDVWLRLLQLLRQKRNTLAFLSAHPDIYYSLLELWAAMLSPERSDLVAPFLRVPWNDSEGFFSLQVTPPTWKLMALLANPIPEAILQHPGSHFRAFIEDLLQNVGTAERRTAAEEVFERLARGNYPDKIRLLNILLKSAATSEDLEKALQGAHLTAGERTQFLEEYGKNLLQRLDQQYFSISPRPILVDWIKRYLQDFNPKYISRSSSTALNFLAFLGSDTIFQHLPRDVQVEVQKWYNLAAFLNQPSAKRTAVVALGNVLRELRLERNPELVERLAVAFASSVDSETELTSVVSMVSTWSPFITRLDLVQMLYSMAEAIRDDQANPHLKAHALARLEPYIRFVLCFDAVYELSSSEKENSREERLFIQTFLRILLQSADADTLEWLNKRSRNWPDRLSQKWLKYRPASGAMTSVSWNDQGLPVRPPTVGRNGPPEVPVYAPVVPQPFSSEYNSPSSPMRAVETAFGEPQQDFFPVGYLEAKKSHPQNPFTRLINWFFHEPVPPPKKTG